MGNANQISFIGTCPEGHFGDTFKFDRPDLEQQLRDGKVILYCNTGKRSYNAPADHLGKLRELITTS
jgi:hypothetical protein